MVKFNEAVFVAEQLECAGPIKCQSISTAGPPPELVLPASCGDWNVQGNLVVEGKSQVYVADAQYLTAGNLSVGNTLPLQDAAINLGDANTAFNTVHAAQIMQTSSVTKKKDVMACPVGLDFVNALRPVVFTRQGGGRQYGFLAEDVYELDGTVATSRAVDYTGLIAPLVQAVQELSRRLASSS